MFGATEVCVVCNAILQVFTSTCRVRDTHLSICKYFIVESVCVVKAVFLTLLHHERISAKGRVKRGGERGGVKHDVTANVVAHLSCVATAFIYSVNED